MASSRVRTLIDWCGQRQITLSNITIVDLPAEPPTSTPGISVLASSNLANSDLVAKIPKDSILSRRTSQLLLDTLDSDTNGDDVMELTLVLAYELALGEQSAWAGYLQSLPHEQVTVAALWDENEDKDSQYAWMWLQGTETARAIYELSTGRTVSQAISGYYNRVAYPIFKQVGCDVTLDDFRRAWSLVSSRSFRVDSYHGLAMVPIADAFNHIGENQVHIETDFDVCPICGSLQSCPHDEDDQESPNLAQVKTDLENTCDMVMNAPVSAGEEIFNSYDTYLPNSVLLARYGFILEGNEHDYVSWDVMCLPPSMQSVIRELSGEFAGVWTEELLNDTSLVYDCLNTSGTSVHTDSTKSPTKPHYRVNSDGLVSIDLWTAAAMCSVKAAGGNHMGSISKGSLTELARVQVAVENGENTDTGDLATVWLQLRILASLVQDLCRSRLEGMYRPELSIPECGDLLDNLSAAMVRSRMAVAQALSERATLIACRDGWGDLITSLDEAIPDST